MGRLMSRQDADEQLAVSRAARVVGIDCILSRNNGDKRAQRLVGQNISVKFKTKELQRTDPSCGKWRSRTLAKT